MNDKIIFEIFNLKGLWAGHSSPLASRSTSNGNAVYESCARSAISTWWFETQLSIPVAIANASNANKSSWNWRLLCSNVRWYSSLCYSVISGTTIRQCDYGPPASATTGTAAYGFVSRLFNDFTNNFRYRQPPQRVRDPYGLAWVIRHHHHDKCHSSRHLPSKLCSNKRVNQQTSSMPPFCNNMGRMAPIHNNR